MVPAPLPSLAIDMLPTSKGVEFPIVSNGSVPVEVTWISSGPLGGYSAQMVPSQGINSPPEVKAGELVLGVKAVSVREPFPKISKSKTPYTSGSPRVQSSRLHLSMRRPSGRSEGLRGESVAIGSPIESALDASQSGRPGVRRSSQEDFHRTIQVEDDDDLPATGFRSSPRLTAHA